MKPKALRPRYFSSLFGIAAIAASLGVACTSEKVPEDRGGKGGAGGDSGGGATGGTKAGTGGTEQGGGGQGGDDSGLVCNGATEACGDVCVNLKTSIEHCGACDNACEGSDGCSSGKCKPRAWGGVSGGFTFGSWDPLVQVAENGDAFVLSRDFNAKNLVLGWLVKEDGFPLFLPVLEHEENIAEYRFSLNKKRKGAVAFVTNTTPRKLYAASFDGTKYGAVKLLDTSEKGIGYSPYSDTGFTLSVEDDGSAVIVYSRYQSGSSGAEDLYFVRAPDVTKEWGAPTPIEESADDVNDLHVVADGEGHLLATWVQSNKALVSSFDGGWSAPLRISGEELYAKTPRASLGTDGKAAIAFVQSEMSGDGDVYRTTFDGSSWAEPSLLVESDANEEYPGVALRSDGSGLYSFKVKGGTDEDDKVFVIPFEKATETLAAPKELTSTAIVAQFPRPFVGPGRAGGVFWANMDDLHRTKIALTDGEEFTEWAVPSGLYHSVIPSIDYNTAGEGYMLWHDSSPSVYYRHFGVQ